MQITADNFPRLPIYFKPSFFSAAISAIDSRIHATLFTTWVLLFLVQTSLVATHRVAIHRRLGVAVGVVDAIMIMV